MKNFTLMFFLATIWMGLVGDFETKVELAQSNINGPPASLYIIFEITIITVLSMIIKFIGEAIWKKVNTKGMIMNEMIKPPKRHKVIGKCRSCGPIEKWSVDGECLKCGLFSTIKTVKKG